MSFRDLGLSEQTIKAIETLGYTEPTTVQKDVIPSVLSGQDILTIAPAACGKTCAYIFPLVDIISKKQGQTILIISADTQESVNISDKFSIFSKYHEDNETATDANVIIASPDLLLENLTEQNIDLSSVNILVVDDINLIKKKRQLKNLDKILEILPSNKQNIVFTTRRSKETQDTLDKILKTPAEIKIDKNKKSEVEDIKQNEPTLPKAKEAKKQSAAIKSEKTLSPQTKNKPERSKAFGYKTPAFLLRDCPLAEDADS